MSDKKGPRGGVPVAFPTKLHDMLSDVNRESPDIVSWQPHGRNFCVHKKTEFVESIMPQYFQQSKITSFQRQLNLYGFIRLTSGVDRGAYYHPLFLRGRVDLCHRMLRTRVKGNGMKAAASPATEPDFYAMEPCPDADSVKDDRLFDEPKYDPLVFEETSQLSLRDIAHSFFSGLRPTTPVYSIGALLPVVSEPTSPVFTVPPDDMMALYYQQSFGCQESKFHFENGDEAFFEGRKFWYLETCDEPERPSDDLY